MDGFAAVVIEKFGFPRTGVVRYSLLTLEMTWGETARKPAKV
jgi:hypothetical protein